MLARAISHMGDRCIAVLPVFLAIGGLVGYLCGSCCCKLAGTSVRETRNSGINHSELQNCARIRFSTAMASLTFVWHVVRHVVWCHVCLVFCALSPSFAQSMLHSAAYTHIAGRTLVRGVLVVLFGSQNVVLWTTEKENQAREV